MSADGITWRSEPDAEGYRSARLKVVRRSRQYTRTVRVKSEREAIKQRAAFMAEIDGGNISNAPARMTTEQWLRSWLASLDGSPCTKANYKSAVECHLIPHLGSIALRELSPMNIKAMFTALATTLKPSTLGQLRNILASAMREAERLDMIPRSPLAKLRGALPVGSSPEAQPADKAKVDAAIAALPIGDPHRAALVLAFTLGLRRGEVCGLRWCDVADDKITVARQITTAAGKLITREPKYGSRRSVSIGPRVAEELRAHRRKLAETLLANGIRLTADHPVCAREDGRPLAPGGFTDWARRRGIKIHGIRHLNASLLITTQPLPIVAQRLGHSRVDTTLRNYSHLLPGQDQAAAEAIDAVI